MHDFSINWKSERRRETRFFERWQALLSWYSIHIGVKGTKNFIKNILEYKQIVDQFLLDML